MRKGQKKGQAAPGTQAQGNPTTVQAQHWQRPDVIAIDRDPSKRYRLVSPERVPHFLRQGMIVDKNYAMNTPQFQTMAAGTSQYRSMVLMCWPREMGEERDKHYMDIQKARLKSSLKAAQLSDAMRRINGLHADFEGDAMSVDGALSKIIVRDGVIDQHGREFSSGTKVHRPGDLSQREVEDLAKTRQAQAAEAAQAS